jgi:hypothetical protein
LFPFPEELHGASEVVAVSRFKKRLKTALSLRTAQKKWMHFLLSRNLLSGLIKSNLSADTTFLHRSTFHSKMIGALSSWRNNKSHYELNHRIWKGLCIIPALFKTSEIFPQH